MASDNQDWRESTNGAYERQRHIREKNIRTDVTFTFKNFDDEDSQFLQAHRLILLMASPVFEAMLFGPLASTNAETIEIEDIDYNTFEDLIRCVYSDFEGALPFKSTDVERLQQLYKAAHKYMIRGLVISCQKALLALLTPGNACPLYEFALQMEDDLIKSRCIEVFQANTMEILENSNFNSISIATLLSILRQPKLAVTSEVDLITATTKWGLANRNPEQTLLDCLGEQVIKSLRILTLTPKQFVNVDWSDLFNKEQVQELYKYLAQNQSGKVPEFLDPSCSIDRQKPKSLEATFTIIDEFQSKNHRSPPQEYRVSFQVDSDVILFGIETSIQRCSARIRQDYEPKPFTIKFYEESLNLGNVHVFCSEFWSTNYAQFRTPIKLVKDKLYSIVYEYNWGYVTHKKHIGESSYDPTFIGCLKSLPLIRNGVNSLHTIDSFIYKF